MVYTCTALRWENYRALKRLRLGLYGFIVILQLYVRARRETCAVWCPVGSRYGFTVHPHVHMVAVHIHMRIIFLRLLPT